MKVNFDGASKGDSVPIGFGVVIRDEIDQLIFVSMGILVVDTNNVAKL
jgi:ribonuclease HI